MKHRFVSHFLYFPGYGYVKRHAIELEDGRIAALFPLAEEVEDTVWLPGVIALLEPENPEDAFKVSHVLAIVPSEMEKRLSRLIPYWLSPFDFASMQPIVGTRRKRLP